MMQQIKMISMTFWADRTHLGKMQFSEFAIDSCFGPNKDLTGTQQIAEKFTGQPFEGSLVGKLRKCWSLDLFLLYIASTLLGKKFTAMQLAAISRPTEI